MRLNSLIVENIAKIAMEKMATQGMKEEDALNFIKSSDPTGGRLKTWILKQIAIGEISLQEPAEAYNQNADVLDHHVSSRHIADLTNKIRNALSAFERKKSALQQKDIQQYTFSSLLAAIGSHKSKSEKREQIRAGREVAFDAHKYIAYRVYTPEMIQEYSKGTKWCTQGERMAKAYVDVGIPWYVLFEKTTEGLNKIGAWTGEGTYIVDLNDQPLDLASLGSGNAAATLARLILKPIIHLTIKTLKSATRVGPDISEAEMDWAPEANEKFYYADRPHKWWKYFGKQYTSTRANLLRYKGIDGNVDNLLDIMEKTLQDRLREIGLIETPMSKTQMKSLGHHQDKLMKISQKELAEIPAEWLQALEAMARRTNLDLNDPIVRLTATSLYPEYKDNVSAINMAAFEKAYQSVIKKYAHKSYRPQTARLRPSAILLNLQSRKQN